MTRSPRAHEWSLEHRTGWRTEGNSEAARLARSEEKPYWKYGADERRGQERGSSVS
jgi:hypothetical protein